MTFHSRARKNRLRIALLGLLGAAVIPASAWAYIETQSQPRLVKTGVGCIEQLSSVTHGGGTERIKVTALAATVGVERQADLLHCKPRSGQKWIRGQQMLGLLKLRTLATGGRPDVVDYCKIIAKTQAWTQGAFVFEHEWSSPPCGPGYYALMACLGPMDTFIGDEGFAAFGSFNVTNVRTDCNISGAWHPAIDGHGHTMGPPVTL